jgi:hypothetical protein
LSKNEEKMSKTAFPDIRDVVTLHILRGPLAIIKDGFGVFLLELTKRRAKLNTKKSILHNGEIDFLRLLDVRVTFEVS